MPPPRNPNPAGALPSRCPPESGAPHFGLPDPEGRIPPVRRALLAWYRRTKRALPWRDTDDPYRIWLSEIMLQQTQVTTVQPYYERFLAAFPTVNALAAAPLERVLKLWEGLGYYTRARHLHLAAQRIVREHGGDIPRTATQWRELPGVGRYTAAAIASIAFDEPVATLDGNAKRVLCRLFRIDTPLETAATCRELERLAHALLDRRSPGDFNQSLMELGARVCTPRNPRCPDCPVREHCAAGFAGVQADLPVRKPRTAARSVTLAAALVRRGQRLLLMKRAGGGALTGLWGLPATEVTDGRTAKATLRRHLWHAARLNVDVGCEIATVRHDFSHRRLCVRVFECAASTYPTGTRAGGRVRWLTAAKLHRLPLSTLDRKLLATVAERRARHPSVKTPAPAAPARRRARRRLSYGE